MQLRQIEVADVPRVARWNVELHEDEHSPAMSAGDAEARLRRWIEEDTFRGVIFVEADELVGYLLFEDRPVHPDQRSGETVYVRQFFVAREHRREGRGRAAFEIFVRDLVPPSTTVVLEVKASNPIGQEFWKSLGFKANSIAFEIDRRDPESE